MVDHCTNFPDRIGSIDFSNCCMVHDLQYDLQVDKFTADYDLYTCVISSGSWGIALIMFVGVSLFGGKYYRNAKKDKSNDT